MFLMCKKWTVVWPSVDVSEQHQISWIISQLPSPVRADVSSYSEPADMQSPAHMPELHGLSEPFASSIAFSSPASKISWVTRSHKRLSQFVPPKLALVCHGCMKPRRRDIPMQGCSSPAASRTDGKHFWTSAVEAWEALHVSLQLECGKEVEVSKKISVSVFKMIVAQRDWGLPKPK